MGYPVTAESSATSVDFHAGGVAADLGVRHVSLPIERDSLFGQCRHGARPAVAEDQHRRSAGPRPILEPAEAEIEVLPDVVPQPSDLPREQPQPPAVRARVVHAHGVHLPARFPRDLLGHADRAVILAHQRRHAQAMSR